MSARKAVIGLFPDDFVHLSKWFRGRGTGQKARASVPRFSKQRFPEKKTSPGMPHTSEVERLRFWDIA
jgi:hypothetical protein